MPDLLKEFNSNLAFHFSEVINTPLIKPYWIYISLSHRCNFYCQMCSVKNILKGYDLDSQTLKDILNEISRWVSDCVIVLTGGEPFLREDIFGIIGHAVEEHLKIEIVSNGSLIDEKLADKIITSRLKNIAISLDGAKKETHDHIRQKGAFKKAVNAIRNLVAAKKKNGFGPQISIWTTIMKENTQELSDIVELAKDLGVECLVYHPVIVAQDDMQNTSPQARFWIRGNDLEVLEDQINRIVDYQGKNGLVAFLHDPYFWVRHFKGTLTKKEWKCNPFVFLNIGPDGEVRSCGSSFGNIKNMSLDQCLNTEEAFRARAIMKRCQKPCLQTCWANPASDSLTNIIDNLISDIRNSASDEKEKKRLLSGALAKLSIYEKMVKEKNA